MKIIHLTLLVIMPLAIVTVGLFGESKMKSIPHSESSNDLRNYIGSIEIEREELNQRELEMLSVLKASLQELDNYHSIYPYLRSALGSLTSALWGFGFAQIILTSYVFWKNKTQSVVMSNS